MKKFALLATAVMTVIMGINDVAAKPLIIAHRGASAHAPENTTPSLQLAWDLGADGSEFDCYLHKSGRVIVNHDKSTSRTGGMVDLDVTTAELSDLAKVDVGAWRGKWFEGTRLPFIEDIFAIHPSGKLQVVEIKDGPETVAGVKKAMEATGHPQSEFAIISFNWDTCLEARKQLPELQVYFLEGTKRRKDGTYPPLPMEVVTRAKNAGMTGLDLHFACVTPEVAKAIKDAGMKLIIYTANDETDIKAVMALGVDGITTDKPSFTRRVVENVLSGKQD